MGNADDLGTTDDAIDTENKAEEGRNDVDLATDGIEKIGQNQ